MYYCGGAESFWKLILQIRVNLCASADQIKPVTGGPAVAEMTMSLDALRQELEGLVLKQAVELERNVVEGLFHTGKGAVVQVVAVRP